MAANQEEQEHPDVIIVGAGLSGIGAACHLQARCPGKRFLILEARDSMGGTWDLFRYPGVRSDSDMHTLGYAFRPWTHDKAIAGGPDILGYIRDTAREHGVDRRIRYGCRVRAAAWNSADARWAVESEQHGRLVTHSCAFLFVCSGYYRYDRAYLPDFPGMADFAGRLVHPQYWTPDIDCRGKRVVVIGSGATAVTLVPDIAQHARQVVMLQRSPSYVVALPSHDAIANWLRRMLPLPAAYALTRCKNVLLGMLIYQLSRRKPEHMKRQILRGVQAQLGPDFDVASHFTPAYKPWDQRLCLTPDGDFFRAIREGRAEVVTDHVERFMAHGIRLRSGRELGADIVIAATGLELQLLGGMRVMVDGRDIDLARCMSYKGMMLSDVPNLAYTVGYTNASWTLRADLVSLYVCRLLAHMDRSGMRQCTPRLQGPRPDEKPWTEFSSGYVQRSIERFPKQGTRGPWRLHQNYLRDLLSFRFGRVRDGAMAFSNPARP